MRGELRPETFQSTGNPHAQRRLCPQCGMEETRADSTYCFECALLPEPPVYHVQAPRMPHFCNANEKIKTERDDTTEAWEHIIDSIWAAELRRILEGKR